MGASSSLLFPPSDEVSDAIKQVKKILELAKVKSNFVWAQNVLISQYPPGGGRECGQQGLNPGTFGSKNMSFVCLR